ncbi:hypothetical protein BHE75_01100 [Sphingomonas haloaromaticamans]|uniref:MPN domain-containing protein n=2 Tax=Edaphosphingomonas haloaromaticamans TaxID=653954 RepID=A0A1S1HAF6_9SPHN|nr:hypothetical protein BHE75_01100 [Sphingomonas haloaromaticamans]
MGEWPEVIEILAACREAMLAAASEEVREQPVLANWSSLTTYLQISMSSLTSEQFRALFLDCRNRLISDDMIWNGTLTTTHFNVRDIIVRSIDICAAAVIVAHNHPSGDATPSRADIIATRMLSQALSTVDVNLHDHVIVCRGQSYSLKGNGLM